MVEVYSRRSTEHVVVLVPELSSKQQLSNTVTDWLTDWVTENATIRIDYSYLRSYLNASREMVLLATRPESSSSLVKCVSNWSDLYIRLSCPSISQSIINTSPLILSLSPSARVLPFPSHTRFFTSSDLGYIQSVQVLGATTTTHTINYPLRTVMTWQSSRIESNKQLIPRNRRIFLGKTKTRPPTLETRAILPAFKYDSRNPLPPHISTNIQSVYSTARHANSE